MLEVKARRGGLERLADLANVGVYENERQVKEVHYRAEEASSDGRTALPEVTWGSLPPDV